MSTYEVRATREGRFWLLHVDGVGTTQARTLREAPEMARSLIEIMLGDTARDFGVHVVPELPERFQRDVDQAHAAALRLQQQQALTAKKSRLAARNLVRTLGLSGRDAAEVLGVSPQRVSQLLAD